MAPNVRLANRAWESVLTAHTVLMRRFAETPIWDQVSMREYDVLYTLSKHGDPIRIGELQSGVLLSQPALSRMVDRLVERGLVERTPDPSDGRVVRVALTEEGRELQRDVGRKHAKDVTEAVGGTLDEGDLEALERICTKLVERQDP